MIENRSKSNILVEEIIKHVNNIKDCHDNDMVTFIDPCIIFHQQIIIYAFMKFPYSNTHRRLITYPRSL